MSTVVYLSSVEELTKWYENNSKTTKELFLAVKKGKPNKDNKIISYIDAVYVALCFGWIDSTTKSVDGVLINKFSPRKKDSKWSELNKERCRYLISHGLMREDGFKVLPDLNEEFVYPALIINELKKDKEAYDFFLTTPKLYQRIRLFNVMFYYSLDKKLYASSLNNLVKNSHNHKLYGEWNDYGRLLKTDV